MTKNQVQQLIVVVLLIVFGMVWTLMRKEPSAGSPPVASAPVIRSGPTPTPVTTIVAPEPSPNTASAPLLARDPFAVPSQFLDRIRQQEADQLREEAEQKRLAEPPRFQPDQPKTPQVAPPPELTLQAIFWGIPNPQAIINRQTVSVGDEISGVKVIAISKEGVTLSINGQETVLKPTAPARNNTREPR